MLRFALSVLRQQEVHGRVILVSDDGENDTEPAVVEIDLYDLSGTNRFLQAKTATDGSFKLCGMSNGVYRMVCGRLRMKLEVVEPSPDATNRVVATPNSLLIFLSRSLVGKEE